jgi:hypothetical protein
MAETFAGLGGKLAARRGASFAALPVVTETREPAPVGDLEAAVECVSTQRALASRRW